MVHAKPYNQRDGRRGIAPLVGEALPDSRPPSWDTEVFVIQAEDRVGLCKQVQALAAFLERQPEIPLKDLAFTLNQAIQPGSSRLALVAGSTIELQARLARAGDRLADATCQQIKDSQGIYYFDHPLSAQGRLAILFPGEGAQYLNMLRDLVPHFPEVRDHIERCDRLSVQGGWWQDPVSQAFFVPDSLSPEDRGAAEKNLLRLGNAVSSILITEWALFLLLQQLGLEADVIGGHSAGEFSALQAAGCLEPDDFFAQQMFALGQTLQAEEDEGQVAQATLLAVAAGRRQVAEMIGPDNPDLFVAMDNCPHQTVLAGNPAAVAAVEERLRAGGVVVERLPFSRPYHTPLFEPLLGPIVQTYRTLPVRPPRVPVYSSTTGQPFSTDPEGIRRLAVAHWAAPVEFIRMVEAMYADGVRLFVEVGPRGNLTSFVEDILRNRPFAAVPVNIQRRSGMTQLNHLVGILTAHHVPLRLEHLYCRRDPQAVAWQGSPEPAGSSDRGTVLARYWDVMENFLDTQREVMAGFLEARQAVPTTATLPMLGEVVRRGPGELVLRRRIDLNEDLYAQDHTLDGRHASGVDPDQHGLPVMPMAFSMEMMAEAASVLMPGKLVVGMKRVRLQRWIQLDEEPITLEVSARLLSDVPGSVAVTIRDLGNATHPGSSETPAVECTVLLGDHYPEPPPVEPFPLHGEGPCVFSPEQLYEGERRMFHGPLFQAVCATDRQGDDGIEGRLLALPHAGLFRSTTEPALLTDPLLIDASTHLLGSWHLSQPDQIGRVVFPYELGSVEFFGPKPATGSQVPCRVRVEKISARQVSHRIELIGSDGRLWCRLAPAEYWRFYWPLEYVNFFRFKEEFLLGQDWSQVVPAGSASRAMRLEPPSDLRQSVNRAALARITLSRAEWRQFRTLKGPDQRLTDWLFGRIAAKDAIRSLWLDRHGERLFPADVEIDTDPHGRPVARHRDGGNAGALPNVSIAHAAGVMAALAAFDQPVGIDLEKIQPRGPGFEDIAFDDFERELLGRFENRRDEAITRFWCAKEAVAKALGRGLAEGPRSVVVRDLDLDTGTVQVALGPVLAAAFPHWRLDLLQAVTVREGDLIVATTFCERAVP